MGPGLLKCTLQQTWKHMQGVPAILSDCLVKLPIALWADLLIVLYVTEHTFDKRTNNVYIAYVYLFSSLVALKRLRCVTTVLQSCLCKILCLKKKTHFLTELPMYSSVWVFFFLSFSLLYTHIETYTSRFSNKKCWHECNFPKETTFTVGNVMQILLVYGQL